MATLDTVARIVGSLPGTAETSSATGLRWWAVKGKMIAWERPLRKTDLAALGDRAPKGIIVGVSVADLMTKAALLSANPDVFFTTPHFDGHASVLVLLAKIDTPSLRALLADAWVARAPKRFARAHAAGQGTASASSRKRSTPETRAPKKKVSSTTTAPKTTAPKKRASSTTTARKKTLRRARA